VIRNAKDVNPSDPQPQTLAQTSALASKPQAAAKQHEPHAYLPCVQCIVGQPAKRNNMIWINDARRVLRGEKILTTSDVDWARTSIAVMFSNNDLHQ
jgi:hypothetical protein